MWGIAGSNAGMAISKPRNLRRDFFPARSRFWVICLCVACLPAQLVEQCLGRLVIRCAGALVEPTVDGGEEIVGLRPPAFLGPEAREGQGSPQSERFSHLTLRNLQRVPEAALSA